MANYSKNGVSPAASYLTSGVSPAASYSTNCISPAASYSTNCISPAASYSTNCISPAASYSLLLVQKRVTREKHTPCIGRLRRLPCAARNTWRLRNSLPRWRGLAQTVLAEKTVLAETPSAAPLLGDASGAPERPPWNRNLCQFLWFLCTSGVDSFTEMTVFLHQGWVGVGPRWGRREAQAALGFRRGLSEGAQRPSSAAASADEHRRAVSAISWKLSAETVTSGVAFFWLLFLAKQEK